uniref:Uncharacterized protein n=1 Tax=Romanomermis culicivorax TaxID=13658 RepID=A0A915J8N2_ROMCU
MSSTDLNGRSKCTLGAALTIAAALSSVDTNLLVICPTDNKSYLFVNLAMFSQMTINMSFRRPLVVDS